MTNETQAAIQDDANALCPLWLSGSTYIPPGPSAYRMMTAPITEYPALLGKYVQGLYEEFLGELQSKGATVDPKHLVLTMEPAGDNLLRITIQAGIK